MPGKGSCAFPEFLGSDSIEKDGEEFRHVVEILSVRNMKCLEFWKQCMMILGKRVLRVLDSRGGKAEMLKSTVQAQLNDYEGR